MTDSNLWTNYSVVIAAQLCILSGRRQLSAWFGFILFAAGRTHNVPQCAIPAAP